MTKRDLMQLQSLANRLKKDAKKESAWINKNRHRCGHDSTPDALGDEGWKLLCKKYGRIEAFEAAAKEIELLKWKHE